MDVDILTFDLFVSKSNVIYMYAWKVNYRFDFRAPTCTRKFLRTLRKVLTLSAYDQ